MMKYTTGMAISAPRRIHGIFSEVDMVAILLIYHRAASTITKNCARRKLNGLNPEEYLTQVLSRIADHPITRIEELLPWKVTLWSAVEPSTDL